MPTPTNAIGQARKFWGTLPMASGPELMTMGKQMEDAGFEGVFMLQLYGPPFAALAAVASGTHHLKLASGVVVAASRSPFETAFAAMDLDRISSGRFVLGMGCSLPATTVGMHGLPNYKLMSHLRDTMAAVRHIIAGAHKGLQPYDGLYYKADYQEMIVTAPPVRDYIPIWIGAMRENMTKLGLEQGDGLLAHSLWTKRYNKEIIEPLIRRSLADYDRKPSDIEISCWPWVAINDDRAQAINDARPTVAYYAGMKAYEDLFALHGYVDEAKACQAAALRQNDLQSVLHLISDDMVLDFVCCGNIDDVLAQIEPFWDVATSLCPMVPFVGLSLEQMQRYGAAIYEMVAVAQR